MDQIRMLDLGKSLPKELFNKLSESFSNGSPGSPFIHVVDLRSVDDYNKHHITTAYSCPAPKLTAEAKTPFEFDDPKALLSRWKDLDAMLNDSELFSKFFGSDSPVLVLCYNGETSRFLTAMLRAAALMHIVSEGVFQHLMSTFLLCVAELVAEEPSIE